ncbi:MAG: 50S ribosomal protein L13 [Promethearchaeota archaeon]|nr:MAG: 50S ribosomal protein L13 [Candidatus Lokiarchaeota archaeon]
MPDFYYIIDATNKIMGRMCTQVAKQALLGYHIVIINAKDTIISGTKREIFEHYLDKLNISTSTNPRRGPFHKRRPDTFLKRVITQMLPKKTIRGKEAAKRVHVYISEIPERFKKRYPNLKELKLQNCEKERLKYYNKIISLENLCDRIGSWKKAEV